MKNIGHSFTVNQVSIEKEFDTYLNIQKRKENILFRSSSNPTNANLSFVQSEDLTSDNNLTINDRSFSLSANRFITNVQDIDYSSVSGFTSETDLFLVTNKFTVDINTQLQIPLFYKHQLSYSLESGETYNNIQVFDKDFNPINTSQYLNEDNFIFSNLQNEFDSSTGLFTIFYISYIVRKSNGLQELYIEILNNHPVFKEADFEDIDPDTGLLLIDSFAYLIQENISNVFDITLPSIDDYSVRRTDTSRIEILPPENIDVNNPWFVKVRNGRFLTSLDSGIKKYYIAEFNSQSFVPYSPYKQIDETSFRVTSRIIKTTKDKIAYSISDGFYPEVIVYKQDGSFKFAITSNPDRLGVLAFDADTYFSNALLGISKVGGNAIDSSIDSILGSSIDTSTGFIVLPTGFEITETDTIRTIYNYEEIDYEFSLIDFNPLSSSDLINQRIVLCIKPEHLGTTETKTLYYLIVNEDGLVLDTDIDFTLSGLNYSDINDLILTSGLWYDRDPNQIDWFTESGIDFVTACSTEGTNLDDILILGDIFVRNSISTDDLILNDIRVRGGGLVEVDNTYSDYWDLSLWDGMPYPGASSIYVEVPVGLTISGNLTPENIADTVNRHIAFGVYPVIHGYNDYQPTITGVNILESGYVQISWTQLSSDARYSLYTKELESSEFVLLAENLSDNTYTYSGIAELYFNIVGYPEGSTFAYTEGSIFDIQEIAL